MKNTLLYDRYRAMGKQASDHGDFKTARNFFKFALEAAKEIADKNVQGDAYVNLSTTCYFLFDFKKAIEYSKRGLSFAEDTADRNLEGRAYDILGNAYKSLCDSKRAIEYFRRALIIAKEIGDRELEGIAYNNLGAGNFALSDSKKAIKFFKLSLCIEKEIGNKQLEGDIYNNLGASYGFLCDFKKAMEFFDLSISVAKENGNRDSQGVVYINIGNVYQCLGDSNKAIKLYEEGLSIVKETENKTSQAEAYINLSFAYSSIGDFKKGVEYSKLGLSIAEEIGDRNLQGTAYVNLAVPYSYIGDFKKAIEYLKLGPSIARETGARNLEEVAYNNLGRVYQSVGDSKKAIEFNELGLSITKETGDVIAEGMSYHSLAFKCFCVGQFSKAEEYCKSSIKLFEETRVLLQGKDEWKISLRDKLDVSYTLLWRIQLQLGHTLEALFTAEAGRAQALVDLMESQYGVRKSIQWSLKQPIEPMMSSISNHISSPTLFLAEKPKSDLKSVVNFWLIQAGQQCQFTIGEISEYLKSLTYKAYEKIGVNLKVRCPNRSLDDPEDEEKELKSKQDKDGALKTLYDVVIAPISPLIEGDELVLVPDRYSFLIPYAALVDQHSRYLSETLRIRLAPSLTCLRLLPECPEGYHSKSGALLVGNPCLETVRNKPWKNLPQLPGAEKEVKMIGQILNIEPLVGKNASKEKVLSGLSSVCLVHIAAHGCPDTGGIILSPNLASSDNPEEKDFLLTMADVLEAQLHAKLVVLSCCYSGQGAIKAEGVVGIARAFLGAGARSVIASLWAISDDATMEFMGHFYEHLVAGKSASKSLHQAMKTLRESGKFDAVKYWAPFVLIGDDVTMNFAQ